MKKKKNKYASSVKSHVYRHLFVLDMEFHSAIGEIMGNDYFVDIYKDIYQRIFLRFRTEHLETPRLFEIIEEHDNLYDAIATQNVKAAKSLIKEHSALSMANLFPIIFD